MKINCYAVGCIFNVNGICRSGEVYIDEDHFCRGCGDVVEFQTRMETDMLTSEFIENLLGLGYQIDFDRHEQKDGVYIVVTLWKDHKRYRRLAMPVEQFRYDFKDIILAMIEGFGNETVHE